MGSFLNPFTRFVRGQLNRRESPNLAAFVEHWDALESLIINTYRSGVATPETEAVYAELRAWLGDHYAQWADTFAPYWRTAREAGVPASSDPFARLFAPSSATAFIDNRPAMQALPAAREALNAYLISLHER